MLAPTTLYFISCFLIMVVTFSALGHVPNALFFLFFLCFSFAFFFVRSSLRRSAHSPSILVNNASLFMLALVLVVFCLIWSNLLVFVICLELLSLIIVLGLILASSDSRISAVCSMIWASVASSFLLVFTLCLLLTSVPAIEALIGFTFSGLSAGGVSVRIALNLLFILSLFLKLGVQPFGFWLVDFYRLQSLDQLAFYVVGLYPIKLVLVAFIIATIPFSGIVVHSAATLLGLIAVCALSLSLFSYGRSVPVILALSTSVTALLVVFSSIALCQFG